MSAERFSYDAVAYPSHPLPQAHPDRLATLAALFGMTPAPPQNCRLLELGCGDGANLVPLAYALPDSRFLGIDLAETAVAKGRAVARELGLTNAELRHADLMELPADLGEFDYVIAHGLYSWVPPAVRDRILKICADHLAPQGVAYVSYNTFPGGRVRQMIRDMMRFHVRDFPEPERRIAQSRSLVKFLAEGHTAEGPYRELLREELRRVGFEKDEAVLYHDDLSEVNDPVYFHEFAAHAAAHGLQYLAEADFFEMQDRLYPPHIAKELRELGERDILLKEQYLDFLKLRRFRQTLLCRREVPIERPPSASRVRQFAVCAAVRPVSGEPNLSPGKKETFKEAKGGSMSTDHALAKAVLLCVGAAYPRAVPFAELVESASKRTGTAATERDVEALCEILLAGYEIGMVDFHTRPPRFTLEPGERPRVSELARLQLRAGEDVVTTLRHSAVLVENALTRQLLLLLDGTRDRPALLDGLVAWAEANPPDGKQLPKREQLRRTLAEQLDAGLAKAAELTLLME